jgi:xylulokinase
MKSDPKCALVGIDVGTGGVRGVGVSPAGELLAEAEEKIRRDHRAAGGIHEQDPGEWWEALCSVGQTIVKTLKEKSGDMELRGVAVTSTSGSLVVADAEGHPLRPAILYDDGRGVEIAQDLNQQGGAQSIHLGPSFSLVKAAWVRRHEPELWERTRYVLHPADWLSGKLSGEFGISDFTNALKLGYDPENSSWIGSVHVAGLLDDRLPVVRRPSEQIGQVSSVAAAETGLPACTPVLAGATDGMASVIASGASRPGDANTTLGTTLVWKVLHDAKPVARSGIYLHLHPGGLWVPGAASNTGLGSIRTAGALLESPSTLSFRSLRCHSERSEESRSVSRARPDGQSEIPRFARNDSDSRVVSPEEMDGLAADYFPTSVVCYMLPGQGERFPFAHPKAESFMEGKPRDAGEFYAAQLQSIGFVERWGYEILQGCAVEVGARVFSTGAAAKSAVLSRLRANVLGRTVLQPRYPTAAFGAAILAATGAVFSGNIFRAIQSMTSIVECYHPSPGLVTAFDEIYRSFREACARRGYVA